MDAQAPGSHIHPAASRGGVEGWLQGPLSPLASLRHWRRRAVERIYPRNQLLPRPPGQHRVLLGRSWLRAQHRRSPPSPSDDAAIPRPGCGLGICARGYKGGAGSAEAAGAMDARLALVLALLAAGAARSLEGAREGPGDELQGYADRLGQLLVRGHREGAMGTGLLEGGAVLGTGGRSTGAGAAPGVL